MNGSEWHLARQVQAILVRHYVDTQRLDIDVLNSSVYIQGELRVFESHPSRKYSDRLEQTNSIRQTLAQVEREIRRLSDVSWLDIKLSNWARQGLNWLPKQWAPNDPIHPMPWRAASAWAGTVISEPCPAMA